MRGNGLRPVVVFDKFIDADLQINLKAGVAKFDKSMLQLQMQFVQTFDVNEPLARVFVL
jgi:hypothetical protein